MEQYFEILDLLEEQSNALPRYQKIHEIVQQPDFHYEQGSADLVLGMFLKSSYWLDRELFDDSYLYETPNRTLSANQMVHLKMVDIGVSLMDKGFPVQYNPAEYARLGPNQMGPYVQTLVEQIHTKYARRTLANKKTPRKITTSSPSKIGSVKTQNTH